MKSPILGITMGDPAGWDQKSLPELRRSRGRSPEPPRRRRRCLGHARRLAAHRLPAHPAPGDQPGRLPVGPGTLECLDLANVDMATLPRGEVSAAAGRAAHEYILRAVDLAKAGAIDGMVTAPINKEALAAAGLPHTGHTEILAELSNTRDYAMLLLGKDLRVIHVTTHVSLRRVPDLVTRERVLRTIRLAQQTMERAWPSAARIAVCGLNPHAGEDGLFGDEEKGSIVPAIEAARSNGLDVFGPLPADTLFSRARGGEFDIVVAMYHDQGHIPVKTLGFTYDESSRRWTGLSGVNVTVGLPFLRVSVDHGTAFDRAWKGSANAESMVEAIEVAVRMLEGRG